MIIKSLRNEQIRNPFTSIIMMVMMIHNSYVTVNEYHNACSIKLFIYSDSISYNFSNEINFNNLIDSSLTFAYNWHWNGHSTILMYQKYSVENFLNFRRNSSEESFILLQRCCDNCFFHGDLSDEWRWKEHTSKKLIGNSMKQTKIIRSLRSVFLVIQK